MDYHFVSPEEKKSQIPDSHKLIATIKKSSPVLIVSAILPVFLFFLYNPPELTYSPRASVNPELRIWFEPSSVSVNVGQGYEIDLYASMDNKEGYVVRNLSFRTQESHFVQTDKEEYSFETPFSAEQLLGTISIYPESSGEHKLYIDNGSVEFEPKLDETTISTGPLSIYVK